jgi:hypothetical protein
MLAAIRFVAASNLPYTLSSRPHQWPPVAAREDGGSRQFLGNLVILRHAKDILFSHRYIFVVFGSGQIAGCARDFYIHLFGPNDRCDA